MGSKYREYNEAYHQANKERRNAQSRAWYAANKERHSELMKARRSRKMPEVLAVNARRRDKMQGDMDNELLALVYAECPKGMQVDHIVPIFKGGKNDIGNLQYLTPSENYSKQAKDPVMTPVYRMVNGMGMRCYLA